MKLKILFTIPIIKKNWKAVLRVSAVLYGYVTTLINLVTYLLNTITF